MEVTSNATKRPQSKNASIDNDDDDDDDNKSDKDDDLSDKDDDDDLSDDKDDDDVSGDDDDEDDDDDDDDDDSDGDSDSDDGLSLDERYQLEKERRAQCQETISSLISQITRYREIVDDEKEKTKKRIMELTDKIKETTKRATDLQSENQQLQSEKNALNTRLSASEHSYEDLRRKYRSYQESVSGKFDEIVSVNQQLNEDLMDTRDALMRVSQRLAAAEEKGISTEGIGKDQEIRLRVKFKGTAIDGIELIPENDEERAAIKEENDILKEKVVKLQQRIGIAEDDKSNANKNLEEVRAECEKLRSEVLEYKDKVKRYEKDAVTIRSDYEKRINEERARCEVAIKEAKAAAAAAAAAERSVSAAPASTLTLSHSSAHEIFPVSRSTGASMAEIYAAQSSAPQPQLQVQRDALSLYNRFLADGAELEIEVPQSVKHDIFRAIAGISQQQGVSGVTRKLFDKARSWTVESLERDLFYRWSHGYTWMGICAKRPSFKEMFVDVALKEDFSAFLEAQKAGKYIKFLTETEFFSQETLAISNIEASSSSGSAPGSTPNITMPTPYPVPALPSDKRGNSSPGTTVIKPTPTVPTPLRLRSQSTFVRDSSPHSGKPQRPFNDSPYMRNAALDNAVAESKTSRRGSIDISSDRRSKFFGHKRKKSAGSVDANSAVSGSVPSSGSSESAAEPRQQTSPSPNPDAGEDGSSATPAPPAPPPPKEAKLNQTLFTASAATAIIVVGDRVWIAHGKQTATISIYDRVSLSQGFGEYHYPFAIKKMIYTGKAIWVVSSDSTIRTIKPESPKDATPLKDKKGHKQNAMINAIALAGKHIWTVGTDMKICIWSLEGRVDKVIDVSSLMMSVVHYGNSVWVATSTGFLFYDADSFKVIKPPPQLVDPAVMASETPEKCAQMKSCTQYSVAKSIVVDNKYVWAAHPDADLISIWDATAHQIVGVVKAEYVSEMANLGDEVWTTSNFDTEIHCWNAKTGEQIRVLSGAHDDTINNICFAEDSKSGGCWRAWCTGGDSVTSVWDTTFYAHDLAKSSSVTGNCPICGQSLKGFNTSVVSCKCCKGFSIHQRCANTICRPEFCCPRDLNVAQSKSPDKRRKNK